MTTPKRGRGGTENFPNARLKSEIMEDPEKRAFMAKAITNNLEMFNVGMKPVKTDDELCERLNFFFTHCAETQQLPTVEKMANCLGYYRGTLNDWENGSRGGFSPRTASIIKKAKQILAAIDAELAQQSKIQPVVYMFRAKNFYDMRDQQEMVVQASPGLAENTPGEIERKYAELPKDLSEDYVKDPE